MIGSFNDMGYQVILPQHVGLNDSWYRLKAGCWSFGQRNEPSLRLPQDVKMSGACYLTQYTEELDHLYPE